MDVAAIAMSSGNHGSMRSILSISMHLSLIGQLLLNFRDLCNLSAYLGNEQHQITDKSADVERSFSKLNNLTAKII